MLRYPLNQGDERSKERIQQISRGLFLMGQMAEMQETRDWLKAESFRIANETCREPDEKLMYRMQGAVLLIDDLIKKIKAARETSAIAEQQALMMKR